ncbi:MFS transporter, partial [Oceanobacillus damuensis]|uniref:MFS transporter n=1 Tax=Oceanobacillus damuensis TaxID=937928 RepID=UPI000AD47215
ALVGVLTLAYLLALMVGLLAMAPLFSRFGKRNTMIGGSIISIIGCLIIMINPTSLFVVVVAQIVKGLGQASLTGALWALLPDTIEYGEWKTGIRNEGVLYSGGSMGQKIGNGLGMAFIGWVLSWGGYNGMLSVQPDSAITSIYTIFIYLPIVIFVAQIILLYFYKLDKVYPKIAADLEAKNEGLR